MYPPRLNRGFTLVELLVVAAILAVVTAVLGACISAGVRVLASARAFNTGGADASLALDLIEKDLMNTYVFYAVPFVGEPQAARFPTLVPPRGADGRPGEGDAVGTVSYAFDRTSGTLRRSRWQFPPAAAPTEVREEAIVSDLRSVDWSYAGASSGPEASWKRQWDNPTNLPVRVRVELTFGDAESVVHARSVVLPVRRKDAPTKSAGPAAPPSAKPGRGAP